ncbi:hypothetical protein GOP47_0011967 [Adiantum capillus-veneris]|uniref:Uncharacterized protein n=1 Tax=Adiantum capillus-veneris TaxID=13818 RepID=A0A9D4UTS0_ADICA|nr:hypothetical protein GOP47_0011967 [Adiantum capillus-veneris]
MPSLGVHWLLDTHNKSNIPKSVISTCHVYLSQARQLDSGDGKCQFMLASKRARWGLLLSLTNGLVYAGARVAKKLTPGSCKETYSRAKKKYDEEEEGEQLHFESSDKLYLVEGRKHSQDFAFSSVGWRISSSPIGMRHKRAACALLPARQAVAHCTLIFWVKIEHLITIGQTQDYVSLR